MEASESVLRPLEHAGQYLPRSLAALVLASVEGHHGRSARPAKTKSSRTIRRIRVQLGTPDGLERMIGEPDHAFGGIRFTGLEFLTSEPLHRFVTGRVHLKKEERLPSIEWRKPVDDS